MNLPNIITIFRILLIPVFVGALLYYWQSGQQGEPVEEYRWMAVSLFLAAAISDALDGFLARAFRQQTDLGRILDPLADKALMVSGLVTLSLIAMPTLPVIPLWFVVLVVGRDIILVAGYVFIHLFAGGIHVRPHWTGKVSTFLQMVLLLVVLLDITWLPSLGVAIVAGFFTFFSMMIYLLRGFRVTHPEPQDKAEQADS